MHSIWHFIFKGAWTVFWITTVYSYVSCSFIGAATGYKTKNDKEAIDAAIEKFIISPFYVATFFSLFASLFSIEGMRLKSFFPQGHHFFAIFSLGFLVFLGHLIVELLESTFIRKDPLRMLGDRDALHLSGIYLILIVVLTFIIGFNI